MKTIKFKKKSSVGDTEHIFVTQKHEGYLVEILTLTKHPEMYKYDYILRIFKGHAVTVQVTGWRESTLREILEAIDIIKNQKP